VKEWNAVISVNEYGFKRAFEVFGGFGEVRRTEFFNVLVMRAENTKEMLERLRERRQRDPESLAFLSRLVPVTHAFIFHSAEEFETKSKEIVGGWASRLAGKRFHVRIRRRGFKGKLSSLEEEKMLDTLLLQELEKAGAQGRVDFEDPDAVIAIESVGTWAGLSLWTREELEMYPFVRAA
jgi:tRNA(Ser,Leu) C12 N-acetylase TAN1